MLLGTQPSRSYSSELNSEKLACSVAHSTHSMQVFEAERPVQERDEIILALHCNKQRMLEHSTIREFGQQGPMTGNNISRTSIDAELLTAVTLPDVGGVANSLHWTGRIPEPLESRNDRSRDRNGSMRMHRFRSH